jgi:hypothetical protein
LSVSGEQKKEEKIWRKNEIDLLGLEKEEKEEK